MPTGYTQMIIDGKVKSPKDFLHLCLRNFGVCVCMRDDEFKVEDDYTPKILEFTQQTIDYHKNALQSAEEHLKQIQQLTEEELYQKYVKENTKSREYYEERLKEAHSINEKYSNFSMAIGKWECSPEYENIKKFALEQLRISYDSTEYLEEQLAKIGDLSKESFQQKKDEYLNGLIEHDQWTINYHKDEMQKAISRQTETVSFYHFFKQELEKLEA